jgi:phosphatidate cytidylyltransferase
MLLRFLSGVVGIPLLIVLIFTGDGTPFILGIAVMSIIGLLEFYKGVRNTGADPQIWAGVASAFLFLFAARHQFQEHFFSTPGVLTLFVIITLMIELMRKNRAPVKNLGATFLGVIYVGWLFSYLVATNSVPGKALHISLIPMPLRYGAWLVLYICFSTWAADTAAFFVGRKWGTHKLAPTLSPGKSWEGFYGGLVGSTVMSVLMSRPLGIPLREAVVLGVGICIAGVVGDLAESSIKRDIGVKDFGSMMPGHGGILDRFDSLLFAAPLFYYYITLVAKIPH